MRRAGIVKFKAGVGLVCGLAAATLAVPIVATSEAGTTAVSFVAETNVVVKAAPLNVMTAPLTKFVP